MIVVIAVVIALVLFTLLVRKAVAEQRKLNAMTPDERTAYRLHRFADYAAWRTIRYFF